VSFFMELPWEIVISLDLGPIYASVVASHGLPRMRGSPPRLDLGYKTMKSMGYSQESTEITTYSRIPFGFIVDRSASCKTVGVEHMFDRFNFSMVALVITLIPAPKLINVLGIKVFFVWTSTIGLPVSTYLVIKIFPNIRSANRPMTWIVWGSLFFLPGFLIQSYLIQSYLTALA